MTDRTAIGAGGTRAEDILIVDSFVSPYVRKVLACMALKGLAYRIDLISPSTVMTISPASRRCAASPCWCRAISC